MNLRPFLAAIGFLILPILCQDPLSYAQEPLNVYTPSKSASVTTLWDLIESRPELSSLAAVLKEPAGRCLKKNTANSNERF